MAGGGARRRSVSGGGRSTSGKVTKAVACRRHARGNDCPGARTANPGRSRAPRSRPLRDGHASTEDRAALSPPTLVPLRLRGGRDARVPATRRSAQANGAHHRAVGGARLRGPQRGGAGVKCGWTPGPGVLPGLPRVADPRSGVADPSTTTRRCARANFRSESPVDITVLVYYDSTRHPFGYRSNSISVNRSMPRSWTR